MWAEERKEKKVEVFILFREWVRFFFINCTSTKLFFSLSSFFTLPVATTPAPAKPAPAPA